MFGSNALSLPPTFAHEHRPLRLTSESARPQPTGECRYSLPHPSAQNQRCSCQSFHHNRSAPGNICECGHQACYHVHETNNEKQQSPETYNAILEKVKRLEETIQNERGNRENALHRERQMWEREVRILREALAPFYNSEKEMRRKLIDIEDRLEGNYDDQLRLKGRVDSIDEATMLLEKRVDEMEGARSKRRRVGRNQVHEETLQNGYVSPDTMRRVSSSIDERSNSIHTPSSRALSPNGVATATTEHEEPRSSGILNLVEMPRPTPPFNVSQRLSPAQEEARSSGFLTLDLAERLSQKSGSDHGQVVGQSIARITPPQDRPSPPSYSRSNPDIPVPRASRTPPENLSTKLPIIDVMVLPDNISPRKRKHHLDHIALDVLADVSVTRPLIH